ncbi:family 20 glycosylhydrolase [Galbibacter mesophilus]|uniref:family 20 glycosylhydrolase n=1 Tax=Galbibacter mesophilus TaxID=379069 RepID=UPI0019203A45|nr:family 20 glycosylhydrolase [Galbibacter mesophilus]MCM5661376.1 family 20 glycosylhydrolase [Galbibacter mesophilus]
MSKFIYILICFFITASCSKQKKHNSDPISLENITPKPQKITVEDNSFKLSKETSIIFNTEETKAIAEFFIDKIASHTGLSISLAGESQTENTIQLVLDDALEVNNEGYRLSISKENILVKAKTNQGLFYGMQSLLQLLPISLESYHLDAIQLPTGTVTDEPEFSWRGWHLDVSRHFFSVEEIKKQLDVLALFKINKFHWHLTDDQGWRIEIKKYPKLTVQGIQKNEESSKKEYYTQEEVKEVVAYAKERFIDVIPEIETPGHAVAALAAYPELSCNPNIKYQPRELWGVDYNIFCAGNEKVFQFLDDVYAEIVPLFPYKYYHAGGDEVPKRSWENCSSCQKTMKENSLKDEEELQSYFMARVEKIIQKHDKIMIGWDEILEGGITPTTNIMSWQGEEGGIKAANAGHDVIMAPASYAYLNFSQGDYRVEPMAHGGDVPLEKVYNYNPIPADIADDKRKHILGMQGNIWTEYAYEGKDIEYYMYPRILAIAELTWSGEKTKNYEDFLKRLALLYPILDHYEINYHIPLPEGPTADNIAFIDSVTVEFETTHPVTMKYTLDGSQPTENSETYKQPLTFSENTEINIASFLPHGKVSKVRKLQLKKVTYKEAQKPKNVQSGLQIQTVKGHFMDADEVPTPNGEISIIKNIEATNTAYDWGKEIDTTKFGASILKGYIEIPEDGVYYFASKQEQVKIADSLIINPKSTLKRFPIEGTIALKKGLHPIEILYLNNVVKGWASDWNEVEVKFRRAKQETYKAIDSSMVFYAE